MPGLYFTLEMDIGCSCIQCIEEGNFKRCSLVNIVLQVSKFTYPAPTHVAFVDGNDNDNSTSVDIDDNYNSNTYV